MGGWRFHYPTQTIQLPVTNTVNFTNSFSEILFSPGTSPQPQRKHPLNKMRTETVRKGVPSQFSQRDTVQPCNDYFASPAGMPTAQEREYLSHRCGGRSLISTISWLCSNYLGAFLSWTHQSRQEMLPFRSLLIQLLSLVREQKSRFVTKGGIVCLQSSQKRATFEASVSLCPWQKIVDKFNLRNEFLLITVI